MGVERRSLLNRVINHREGVNALSDNVIWRLLWAKRVQSWEEPWFKEFHPKANVKILEETTGYMIELGEKCFEWREGPPRDDLFTGLVVFVMGSSLRAS
jgi:hypothetical protein